MARQVIDIDTDHGTYKGDPARTAFGKANDNFAELYNGAGSAPGAIQGLGLIYVSSGVIRIDSGAAKIPESGLAQTVTSPLDLTVSVGANAWGHVYLRSNQGASAAEISTTAPTVYSGTARTKNGSLAHRYLGSIRTDASGAVHRFTMVDNVVMYSNPNANSGGIFRVLSNKQSAAEQSISLANIIPVSATAVIVRQLFTRTASDNASNIGNAAGNYLNNVGGSGVGFIELPLVTQSFYARLNQDINDGNGGMFVDVQGYRVGR